MCFTNIFSQPMFCLYILLTVLDFLHFGAPFYVLISILSFFVSNLYFFVSHEIFANSRSHRFSHMVPSRSFIVVGLPFGV